ncbi:MAG: hypothetical protein R3B54_15930 [Bdellovibrionota bacterium]
MEKGRKILSGWLAVALLLASLYTPGRSFAEEPDIIEPPLTPSMCARAALKSYLRERQRIQTRSVTGSPFFWRRAFSRTVPSIFGAAVETIKDSIAISRKNKELEEASKRAEVRHADRLEALKKAAEAYDQALKDAETGQKTKAKEAKIKQTGKNLAAAFNAIIDFENRHLEVNKHQGTLRYDADKNTFHSNSPLGGREPYPDATSEKLRKSAMEACAVSYQQITNDIGALKWKRWTNWAWPLTYAVGTAGATTWWRYVAKQRKDNNGGKSVLEIQSDKIKANSAKLAKATDLAHQLESLDDPKWKEINNEFTEIIMEVLQHNEKRIVDYFKEHVPKEIQAMLDIEQIVHDSLHGEHGAAMLRNVLPKSMSAAAKATLGEATPQDVMGIIGTKDIAKQETDTKSFLIILYAEIFNRMWPKLAFKNTNGDSHMILVSPIISDSLSRMRGLKLKIQEQQKEKKADGNQANSPAPAPDTTASASSGLPTVASSGPPDTMAGMVTKSALDPTMPSVMALPDLPK